MGLEIEWFSAQLYFKLQVGKFNIPFDVDGGPVTTKLIILIWFYLLFPLPVPSFTFSVIKPSHWEEWIKR